MEVSTCSLIVCCYAASYEFVVADSAAESIHEVAHLVRDTQIRVGRRRLCLSPRQGGCHRLPCFRNDDLISHHALVAFDTGLCRRLSICSLTVCCYAASCVVAVAESAAESMYEDTLEHDTHIGAAVCAELLTGTGSSTAMLQKRIKSDLSM